MRKILFLYSLPHNICFSFLYAAENLNISKTASVGLTQNNSAGLLFEVELAQAVVCGTIIIYQVATQAVLVTGSKHYWICSFFVQRFVIKKSAASYFNVH